MRRIVILFIIMIIMGCKNKPKQDENLRMVVASPEIAEIIYKLDGIERIVGISTQCDFPKKLNSLPKIGGFGSINIENIINLAPTIVFTAGHEQQQLANELEKLNIEAVIIESNNFSDLLENIELIGKKIDRIEEANKLVDSMKFEIAGLQMPKNAPKVYIEIYSDPIMTVNDNSFVADIIHIAGGKNLFSDLARPYCRINQEDVINKNPDYLIKTCPIDDNIISSRKGWQNISAIKNNRIINSEMVKSDWLVRAGPRSIKAIKEINRIFLEDE
ncbi:MAG: helical backbone metal receptor [Candidatus Cloacimonadota bacterium]|nr:helical backbone metal receptor [Candidatus Cloacimonadota bacterium]